MCAWLNNTAQPIAHDVETTAERQSDRFAPTPISVTDRQVVTQPGGGLAG
jgi:hypothetical protein